MWEDAFIGLLLSAGSNTSEVLRLCTEYIFVVCAIDVTISLEDCHLFTQEREQICFIVVISSKLLAGSGWRSGLVHVPATSFAPLTACVCLQAVCNILIPYQIYHVHMLQL